MSLPPHHEPCSACYEPRDRIELNRYDGRCGDCRDERRPVAMHVIPLYTDLRRGGMSTADACAHVRNLLAEPQPAAAE